MKITLQKSDFNQYGERFDLIFSYPHAGLRKENTVEIKEMDYNHLTTMALPNIKTETFKFPDTLRERVTVFNDEPEDISINLPDYLRYKLDGEWKDADADYIRMQLNSILTKHESK